jgi:gentisate 1,2-dioxygenase
MALLGDFIPGEDGPAANATSLGMRVLARQLSDMRLEQDDANERRGAGGKSVFIQFPNSELTAHMSVFAPKTYKKAHRHGPGRAIIIPAGEGYSIMWEEGKEKIVCPWHECSMVTPPNKWFHQHFNAGGDMARYLALAMQPRE